jgi:hypothetical protein
MRGPLTIAWILMMAAASTAKAEDLTRSDRFGLWLRDSLGTVGSSVKDVTGSLVNGKPDQTEDLTLDDCPFELAKMTDDCLQLWEDEVVTRAHRAADQLEEIEVEWERRIVE